MVFVLSKSTDDRDHWAIMDRFHKQNAVVAIEDDTLHLSLPHHVLWMDIGSAVSDDVVVTADHELLRWLHINIACEWLWCTRERAVYRITDDGLDLKDVRQELWISIEDPALAVLSKLTWMGLRSSEYAEHRGLSRTAGCDQLGSANGQ